MTQGKVSRVGQAALAAVASLMLVGPVGATPRHPHDPNDTRGEAMNLGDLGRPVSHAGWIGGLDGSDFYRFRVRASGATSIRLDGPSADAALRLEDDRGRVLGRRSAAESAPITAVLQSGRDYFLRITSQSTSSRYGLTVDPPTLRTPMRAALAGGPSERVANLGVLTGDRPISGWIGGDDRVDAYRFRVRQSGPTSFDLSSLPRGVMVMLVDRLGRSLSMASPVNRVLTQNLVSGVEYGVRVMPAADVEPSTHSYYRFTVNTPRVAASPSLDRNATRDGAAELSVIDSETSFRGWIGGADRADYSKFTVTRSGIGTIRVGGFQHDTDVRLEDASGRVLRSSERSGLAEERVRYDLRAGEVYYVRVESTGQLQTTEYRLAIDPPATPIADRDATPVGARSLGVVSSRARTSGQLGWEGDATDHFRFRLARSGPTLIRLAGLTRDVRVGVTDATGRSIGGNAVLGSESTAVRVNLQAGNDYYLRLDAVGTGPVTPYRVHVLAPTPETPSVGDDPATDRFANR